MAAWAPPINSNENTENRCPSLVNHTGKHYVWTGPPSCPFTPWSAESFCRIMRGRELLIVGDSMHKNFHVSVQSALPALEPNTWEGEVNQPCLGHTLCATDFDRASGLAPVRMTFKRNSLLSLIDVDTGALQTWKSHVTNNSVVLLSRGPHFVGEPEFSTTYNATLDWIRRTAPGALVVVRSTPQGHLNWAAKKTSRPLESLEPQSNAPVGWQWDQFPKQNDDLHTLLRTSGNGYGGVLWLDVAPATNLRADSHHDPLHYCTPGPADWWLAFLHHALVETSRVGTVAPRSDPAAPCTVTPNADLCNGGGTYLPAASSADCCAACKNDVRCIGASYKPGHPESGCWIKYSGQLVTAGGVDLIAPP